MDRARPGHEGARRPDGARAEQGDAPQGVRLRRPLPRAPAPVATGGRVRGPVRPGEPRRARSARRPPRVQRRGPLLLGRLADPLAAAGARCVLVDAARRRVAGPDPIRRGSLNALSGTAVEVSDGSGPVRPLMLIRPHLGGRLPRPSNRSANTSNRRLAGLRRRHRKATLRDVRAFKFGPFSSRRTSISSSRRRGLDVRRFILIARTSENRALPRASPSPS